MRVGRYEIDILGRDGATIVLVEVRARRRGGWVRPLDSVSHAKQERLRRAADILWRERFAKDDSAERVRFDLIGVTMNGESVASLEHVRAAFSS